MIQRLTDFVPKSFFKGLSFNIIKSKKAGNIRMLRKNIVLLLFIVAFLSLNCVNPTSNNQTPANQTTSFSDGLVYKDSVGDSKHQFSDLVNLQTTVTPESVFINIELKSLSYTMNYKDTNVGDIAYRAYFDMNSNGKSDSGDLIVSAYFFKKSFTPINDSTCSFTLNKDSLYCGIYRVSEGILDNSVNLEINNNTISFSTTNSFGFTSAAITSDVPVRYGAFYNLRIKGYDILPGICEDWFPVYF